MAEKLSLPAARRIALAAQGFGDPRPARAIDQGHLRRVLGRVQLHQIDSVNVLARAHYLPLFSRLGAYPRALLDRAAWGRPRRMFEYWAHEASLLPLELHPLLRWRMERARRGEGMWSRMRAFANERRPEAEAVLARIREEGPLAASDFPRKQGGRGLVGLERCQDRARMAVLGRASDYRHPPQQLRARLRSAGTRDPRRHPRASDS
jgi:hypothetical protein